MFWGLRARLRLGATAQFCLCEAKAAPGHAWTKGPNRVAIQHQRPAPCLTQGRRPGCGSESARPCKALPFRSQHPMLGTGWVGSLGPPGSKPRPLLQVHHFWAESGFELSGPALGPLLIAPPPSCQTRLRAGGNQSENQTHPPSRFPQPTALHREVRQLAQDHTALVVEASLEAE